jgi:hypothetical protein
MSKPILPDLADFLNEDSELVSLNSLQTLTSPERFNSLVKAGKNDNLLALFHAEKERFVQLEWLQSVVETQQYNDEQEALEGSDTGKVDEDELPVLYVPVYREYGIRPPTETFSEWQALKTPEYLSNKKLNGFDYNGVQVSLNLTNQSGIVDLKVFEDYAKAAGGTIFPFNFKADTPSGTDIIPFTDETDFLDFVNEFSSRRVSLF